MKNYNFLLDESLMDDFKVLAKIQKKNYSDALTDLIESHIRENYLQKIDELKETKKKELGVSVKEKKFNLPDIFKNLPNRNVVYVWDHGVPQRIQPKPSQEMTCPMCGGSVGYSCLYDPKVSGTEWIWGCLEMKCIKINTAGAKKIGRGKQKGTGI